LKVSNFQYSRNFATLAATNINILEATFTCFLSFGQELLGLCPSLASLLQLDNGGGARER